MKKTIALLLAICIICSCKKSSDSVPVNHVTCKINGVSYSVTGSAVTYLNVLSGLNTVNSVKDLSDFFTLVFGETVGTYTFDEAQQLYSISHTNASSNFSTKIGTGHGTITVSEVSPTSVKGTFSATLDDGYGHTEVITEGDFYYKN